MKHIAVLAAIFLTPIAICGAQSVTMTGNKAYGNGIQGFSGQIAAQPEADVCLLIRMPPHSQIAHLNLTRTIDGVDESYGDFDKASNPQRVPCP